MGYLSVFLKGQITALTKADHNKRDVEQLLSWFAKFNESGSVVNVEQNFIGLYTIVVQVNTYANKMM